MDRSDTGDETRGEIRGSRQPKPVRDTVVMYNPDIFGGIQNIPVPEFEELAKLISENFGIRVGENKRTLVTGRIHPMMEKYGFADHREFLEAIKMDKSGVLLSELANRISTNHTAFFREDAHFDLMRDTALPELIARKTPIADTDLRVWCAACATGEEAYSILFTMMKFLGRSYPAWRAGVLATDISAEALQTGKTGRYNEVRMAPVPHDVRNLYFDRVGPDVYEVKPEFRKEVTFRRLNLVNDTYPFKKKFDMIFCRNVMIYFTGTLRKKLLTRLHDWLNPGGFLFIGHSESLVGPHDGYEYVAPATYRRSD